MITVAKICEPLQRKNDANVSVRINSQMQDEINKTDQELVSTTLLDKHAFSAIVKKYEESLRRYVMRLGCRDKVDSDDVLQEIFIKVYINLNDYDPDLKFSSWIYRIAHNETISFFRKKNIRPSVLTLSAEDTDAFFAQLADDKDFVELANKRDDKRVIQELLSELEPKYREVIVLRYLEDKSYTEISDILKMPEGTVGTLVNRGKKRLKEILEEKGIKQL
jgi:RNA polymerase sigma-70 factor (ECF subfamily)